MELSHGNGWIRTSTEAFKPTRREPALKLEPCLAQRKDWLCEDEDMDNETERTMSELELLLGRVLKLPGDSDSKDPSFLPPPRYRDENL